MIVKSTELRANLYRLLDRVLSTGEPLEVERKGRRIRIAPATPKNKLSRLEAHPEDLVGDPDDLVHLDWSHEWNP